MSRDEEFKDLIVGGSWRWSPAYMYRSVRKPNQKERKRGPGRRSTTHEDELLPLEDWDPTRRLDGLGSFVDDNDVKLLVREQPRSRSVARREHDLRPVEHLKDHAALALAILLPQGPHLIPLVSPRLPPYPTLPDAIQARLEPSKLLLDPAQQVCCVRAQALTVQRVLDETRQDPRWVPNTRERDRGERRMRPREAEEKIVDGEIRSAADEDTARRRHQVTNDFDEGLGLTCSRRTPDEGYEGGGVEGEGDGGALRGVEEGVVESDGRGGGSGRRGRGEAEKEGYQGRRFGLVEGR